MSELLTQDEVDALLRGLEQGEEEASPAQGPGEEVAPLDLSSEQHLALRRLPTLEVIHERFRRGCQAHLISLLRQAVQVDMEETTAVRFGTFLDRIPVPTCLVLFGMEPLKGSCFLNVDAPMALAWVDCLFGGPGNPGRVEGKEFTPIERTVIQRVVEGIIRELQEAWRPVLEVRARFLRMEMNPLFAAVLPPAVPVVRTSFSVTMERCQGVMSLCLPHATLEPILPRLQANFQGEVGEDEDWFARLRDHVMQVPLEVVVELGRARLSMGELASLEEGQLVLLDTPVEGPVSVRLEGVAKFEAKVGAAGGSQAVRICRPLP